MLRLYDFIEKDKICGETEYENNFRVIDVEDL